MRNLQPPGFGLCIRMYEAAIALDGRWHSAMLQAKYQGLKEHQPVDPSSI